MTLHRIRLRILHLILFTSEKMQQQKNLKGLQGQDDIMFSGNSEHYAPGSRYSIIAKHLEWESSEGKRPDSQSSAGQKVRENRSELRRT